MVPGSFQRAGRRVGKIPADQSVGGTTVGEEAAVAGECSLLKTGLGFFGGESGYAVTLNRTSLPIAKV